jgi:hypothetical protein
MANRDGQRIGGIGPRNINSWELEPNHVVDLFLVCVPHANDCLLDRIRRVFTYRYPCLCRDKHRNPAGLTKFEGSRAVLVDKRLFYRRSVGSEFKHD